MSHYRPCQPGYFNKPKETAETVDKDGWLLTGDIAYVNERGEVFVVDRVKELIKYKGFQVSLLIAHVVWGTSFEAFFVDRLLRQICCKVWFRARRTLR
jgi:hypothetical protein